MDRAGVTALIAEVPDYPLPGVVFKDVTPISADPDAAHWVTSEVAARSSSSVFGYTSQRRSA
jgi:hypothetical protein